MDKLNKAKVNAIIEKLDVSPLYFVSPDITDSELYTVARLGYRAFCKTHSLNDSVLKTIELMLYNSSMKKEKKQLIFETPKNKRRSAVDIWRHLKSALPDLEFTDVLSALYELCCELKLTTSYCFTIKRRTFRVEPYNKLYNTDYPDEFGLLFQSWKG